jgi:hypothetical protein
MCICTGIVLAETKNGEGSAGPDVVMDDSPAPFSQSVLQQNFGNEAVSDTISNEGNQAGSPESSVVAITGVNAVNFPYILTYVTVNTSAGRNGKLSGEDFLVYEDGNLMDFTFIPFSDKSIQTKLDLAIVFDDTGSLEDEIGDMKEKVNELTTSITAANIDCRYALISFKDTVSVKQQWTSDVRIIKNAVNELIASGGDDAPEVNLDAIQTALEMGFRPDAQHMILDITDDITHYRDDGTSYTNLTISELADRLLVEGASLILIGPTSVSGVFDSNNDKRELVKALGGSGLFFDIHGADFSEILDKIKRVITQTYTIGYYTSNPVTQGNKYTILVRIGNDSDSGQYVASGSNFPMVSGRITPDMVDQCTNVLITIPGSNFLSGATVRLFRDSDVIDLTEISVTSSAISGYADIPCNAQTGSYSLEITNPGGIKVRAEDVVFISSSDISALTQETGSADDKNLTSYSSGTEGLNENDTINDTCEGWQDNSRYYLKDRVIDANTPEVRISNPWCWCSGSPYNKNYQTCIPIPS